MQAASLDTITDLDTLRSIARRHLEMLESERATHQSEIVAREALIAERDRTIVYKSAKIEALTLELARLKRLQYAARSERLRLSSRRCSRKRSARISPSSRRSLRHCAGPRRARRPAKCRSAERCRRSCHGLRPVMSRPPARAANAAALWCTSAIR